MADQVRQPVQKRSIETKNKIINAAYDLFSDVGYFSTNTAEIAKYAGVSTGIVYGYFKNKRDIMLEVVELYIERMYGPIITAFDEKSSTSEITSIIHMLLSMVVDAHIKNAKIHEAINSLTHTDELVMARFTELEDDATKRLAELLISHGYAFPDVYERVHVAMNIVQAFSHESIEPVHSYINMNSMRQIVENILVGMFKS